MLSLHTLLRLAAGFFFIAITAAPVLLPSRAEASCAGAGGTKAKLDCLIVQADASEAALAAAEATIAALEADLAAAEAALATNAGDIFTNASAITFLQDDVAAISLDFVSWADFGPYMDDIAANATDIGVIQSDYVQTAAIAGIATNTAGIATNAAAIADNDADIASNAAAIGLNATATTANTGGISTNAGDIFANASAITFLQNDLAAIPVDFVSWFAFGPYMADIVTNAGGISTNAGNIGTNATNIGTNATNIGTSATIVSANTVAVAAATTGVANNATAIANNATGIANNATAIGLDGLDILANSIDIGVNATNIASNAAAIGLDGLDILANSSDIAINTTGIANNAAAIAAIDTSSYATQAYADAAVEASICLSEADAGVDVVVSQSTDTCTTDSYGTTTCADCSQVFTLDGTLTAGNGPFDYVWSVLSGAGVLDDPTSAQPTVTVVETATLGVTTEEVVDLLLTATDCQGEVSTDTVQVTLECKGVAPAP